jgi:two-component system, OmpR family, sensor histidine kinase MtrB
LAELFRFVTVCMNHMRGDKIEQSRSPDLAHIVHDLRNPLATIALEAAVLDANEVTDAARTHRALQRIMMNVHYLSRLIDDLLDLGALGEGRLTIRFAPTEMRALLEHVITRVNGDHDRLVLEAPQPITTRVDELRIERVVANLLQNALKYAPVRSAIVVRLDRIDALVRVSVTDVGAGIDPAEREVIFEEYRRGLSAAGHDGSGLGLFVSRRIVEAHAGRIGVDNVRGGGTCFFFELPIM